MALPCGLDMTHLIRLGLQGVSSDVTADHKHQFGERHLTADDAICDMQLRMFQLL